MSCEREIPYSGPDIEISFSDDTLRFDTVFTTIGSATRSIKIFNKQNRTITIPKISLSDNGQYFRINVDGSSGTTVDNIIIHPMDSIYVFAEVTIDPDQPLSISPFIIEEQLIVDTQGKEYFIHLEAWGQNANYFPSKASKGRINLLSCDLQDLVWDDPKPYVIYGVLAIDSCNLVFPPGTHIYVHGGIAKNENTVYNDGLLLFLENGRLRSEGSLENPVIIEGDRLEPEFDNVQGQWAGIRFFDESTGNHVQQTIIKNSIVGIRVDSLAELTIKESKIFNTAGSGLIGYNAIINAENCLLYNNGGYGIQGIYGGNYTVTYCTVVNYDNQAQGMIFTNYRCSDANCLEEIFVSPLFATISNNIIDGNADEELIIDDISDGSDPSIFNVTLSHNLIKSEDQDNNTIFQSCDACLYLEFSDTLFVSLTDNNYQLDTNSVAEMKAIPIEGISSDILGQLRDMVSPDLGCYEFQ